MHVARHLRGAREQALVLEALGIPYDLGRTASGSELRVPAASAQRAAEQLAAYARENAGWPPVDDVPEPGPWSRGAFACVAYAALVSAVHLFQTRDPWHWQLTWAESGVLSSARVQDGEWWRCVTALSLHADVPHLMGNLLFGAVFGALACQLVGSGLAWCAILTAGLCGNLANAWLQQPDHSAVGASTAVFGAVGLIAAYRWRRRDALSHGRLSRWAPLFVGVALVGFLGTSGERVDVLAHATGFGFGLLTGVGAASLRLHRGLPGTRAQVLLALLPPSMLAACWWWALTRP